MVFRGAELECDNFELIRGQSHVIKVTQRSKTVDQKPELQNKELKMHGATLNLSDECVYTEWAVAGAEKPG